MNQHLGLRLLGQIMAWPDERARDEFQWIGLMSRLKYDGYEAFRAGARFVESLCVWLQQFKQEDRETAYSFVRNKLVYIGPAEMQILVERFCPDVVERLLVKTVARRANIPAETAFNEAPSPRPATPISEGSWWRPPGPTSIGPTYPASFLEGKNR